MKEFEAFSRADEITPPTILTENIFSKVRSDLNPDPIRLFGKVGIIHLVVGAIVVMICPQFGLGLYESTRLLDFFMQFGHYTCMIACGAFFLGSTAVVPNILLTSSELRVVRERKLSYFSILSLLTMTTFLVLGGDVVFSFALTWMLGALAGAVTIFEMAWATRIQLGKKFA